MQPQTVMRMKEYVVKNGKDIRMFSMFSIIEMFLLFKVSSSSYKRLNFVKHAFAFET